MSDYVIKGNICYSENKDSIKICDDSYLVCIEGKCAGVFAEIPEKYRQLPVADYGDSIIIPGLCDLHLHASQYAYRGLGMDMELLDWLNVNAFPEEARFENMEYAKKAYDIFAEDLLKSATTRVCIFATVHKDATLYLMDALDKKGIRGYAGKVNMDRNCPEYLCESGMSETEDWIRECSTEGIKPVLTPRFIPSCSDEMMQGLGKLREKYDLPVQSHLSENLSEIELVKSLCDVPFYGEGYNRYGLFNEKTVMAHCIYSSDDEIRLMKENGVYIAHCPESNLNIASGIAPVRRYLDMDMNIGLGSDVAGGADLSLFKAMTHALRSSCMYYRLIDSSCRPLTVAEAFYMGTKGGGSYFGKVGSFEEGYELDAVVIDDSSIKSPGKLDTRKRLERIIYLSDDRNVAAKYVSGRKIYER